MNGLSLVEFTLHSKELPLLELMMISCYPSSMLLPSGTGDTGRSYCRMITLHILEATHDGGMMVLSEEEYTVNSSLVLSGKFHTSSGYLWAPYLWAPTFGPPTFGSLTCGPPTFGPPTFGLPTFGPPTFGSPIPLGPLPLGPYLWVSYLWVPYLWVPYLWVPTFGSLTFGSPIPLGPYLWAPTLGPLPLGLWAPTMIAERDDVCMVGLCLYEQLEHLENLRLQLLSQHAFTIQCAWRRALQRVRQKQHLAATTIQTGEGE